MVIALAVAIACVVGAGIVVLHRAEGGRSSAKSPVVMLPPGATLIRSLDTTGVEVGLWRDASDCLELQVTSPSGSSTTAPRCADPVLRETVAVSDGCFYFTDKPQPPWDCRGDCGRPPCQIELDHGLVWGQLPPEAGYACLGTGNHSLIVRPDANHVTLAEVPSGVGVPGGANPATFLPDGRVFDGPARDLVASTTISGCRAAAGVDAALPDPTWWPLRIEVPPQQVDQHHVVCLRTDTGYSFCAGYNALVAPNSISLYADTAQAVVLLTADDDPAHARPVGTFAVPELIRRRVGERIECPVQPALVVRLRADNTAEVDNDPPAPC